MSFPAVRLHPARRFSYLVFLGSALVILFFRLLKDLVD